MTLRVTASTVTFAASAAAGTKVASTVALLTDYVPSTASIHPTALTLAGAGAPVDLLVTEVILRSEKNPEVAHRLYKGPAVGLDAIMGAMGRDALRNGSLTGLEFAPDHGMEVEWTYENGTTVYSPTLLWDVQNQLPDAAYGALKRILASTVPSDKKSAEVLNRLITVGPGG